MSFDGWYHACKREDGRYAQRVDTETPAFREALKRHVQDYDESGPGFSALPPPRPDHSVLAFVPTAKDDKQLQVNNLQVAINRHQVYVYYECCAHEKCDEPKAMGSMFCPVHHDLDRLDASLGKARGLRGRRHR